MPIYTYPCCLARVANMPSNVNAKLSKRRCVHTTKIRRSQMCVQNLESPFAMIAIDTFVKNAYNFFFVKRYFVSVTISLKFSMFLFSFLT